MGDAVKGALETAKANMDEAIRIVSLEQAALQKAADAINARAIELDRYKAALDERETKVDNREKSIMGVRQELADARCSRDAAEKRELSAVAKLQTARTDIGILRSENNKLREAYSVLQPVATDDGK